MGKISTYGIAMTAYHTKIPKEKEVSTLICFLLELKDTFIFSEDIKKLVSRFLKPKSRSIAENVSLSILVQAIGFLEAISCLEFAIECRNNYNTTKRYIRTHTGEVFVYVNRVIVMDTLRILPHEEYEE